MLKIILSFVNYPIDNRYLIIYILTINKESSMKTDKNSSMYIEVGKFHILIDKYAVLVGSIPSDWEFITMFVLPDDKRVDVYFSKKTGDWWVTRYVGHNLNMARITDVNSCVNLLSNVVAKEMKNVIKAVRKGKVDLSHADLFVGNRCITFSADANNTIYASLDHTDATLGENVSRMMLGTLAKVKIDVKLLKRLIANYCIGRTLSLT